MLAPVAVAPMPAFAEGCQSSCEAECLKIAPGSKDYCASACSDECSAMKEEGKSDEEMTQTTGAFGSVREKETSRTFWIRCWTARRCSLSARAAR